MIPKRLFDKQICFPDEIDFLLFCTESQDSLIQPSSPIIHEKLELQENCGVLDYNHGCSGFVYGLALSKSLIESGLSENILLLTGETYSKHINPKDKSARTIFGDGAAATLISSKQSDQEMLGSFLFGTDGSGSSIVGEKCWLGVGCSTMQKIKLGDNCLIGIGAVIFKDVLPGAVMAGNTAKLL